jgi:Do/DeqQ family serine protease
MKKFMPLLLAAFLGSAIMYGVVRVFDGDAKAVRIEHVNAPASVGVAYTTDERGEMVPLDFTEASEKVMDAVVNIRVTSNVYPSQQVPSNPFDFFFSPPNQGQQGPRVSGGSGVIISSDGYIITNNHVVESASDIEVTLNDKRSYKAKLVGTDPSTDIAVIQIRERDLPTLRFSDSDAVKVGEWVLAVGNPFNLNSTVTAGIVSAKARNIGILRQNMETAVESFIQTDAVINPGNSGGALVNLTGDLVGINTAIQSNTGSFVGYGFAVPSNIASKVAEDLIEYGMVQRGLLGVQIRDIDAAFAKEENLPVLEGAYVAAVNENSAAERAGIEAGDVIVKVDGQGIKTNAEVISKLARKRPGDEVALTVLREGKEQTLSAVLMNEQGENALIAKRSEGGVRSFMGADFEAIDEKLAAKLNIPGGIRITNIRPNGAIRKQRVDIKEGFIVTKVDGRPVSSPEEIEKIIASKEGGVLLEGVYEDVPGIAYYGLGLDF